MAVLRQWQHSGISCLFSQGDNSPLEGGGERCVSAPGMTQAPILVVEDLSKRFPVQRGFMRRTVAQVHAVDGVSFDVAAGETLCVVGESGCGKSTLARLILRLIEPSGGRIVIEGKDVTTLRPEAMRAFRQRVQM